MNKTTVIVITSHDGEIPPFKKFGINIETENGSQTQTEFTVELTDEQREQIQQLDGFISFVSPR